jgi:3-oxoadipate enol-lactonase
MADKDQLLRAGALDVRGSGYPVVFIHGLGGTLNVWEPQVRMLATRFKTIRYDLRGSGRHRASAPLSMEQWTDDLRQLLDELGVERAHFVGHSLGTLIIQHFAARFRERAGSLALLGVNRSPPEARRASVRQRADEVREHGIAALVDSLIGSVPSPVTRERKPVAIAAIREMICAQDVDGYAWTCEAMAASWRPDLSAFSGRLLLIAGADDNVSPEQVSRAMAQEYPAADLLVLPECGHWIPLEQPDSVNEALHGFLEDPQASLGASLA